MGQHLQTLDEMAHTESRTQAQERRQHLKDKKVARKDHSHKHHDSQSQSSSSNPHNDDEDDHDHEEDDEEDHEEGVLPNVDRVKERMQKVIAKFIESLKGIRGAEPTPELFEDLPITAYGTQNPLKSVAQVVIVSPTLASITCFDPAITKDVAKALQVQMSLNPSIEDGGVVRVPLPRVSMESRQATATQLGKRTESYRKRIRTVRQKALHVVKPGVAGKLEGISKDDAFRVQKDIEAATEEAMTQLNKLSKDKHDTILAV
jgi:ribosome recycling factor